MTYQEITADTAGTLGSRTARAAVCLTRLLDGFMSYLAPPRCRCCHTPLFGHGNPFLCPACTEAVSWIGGGACRGCGYPAGKHAVHAEDCIRCRGRNFGLTGAVSVARYRAGARSLVRSFKFRGETELAAPIGGLMAERFAGADFRNRIDFLVSVPLHPARLRQRGFDQAGLLAEWVGKLCGVPVRHDLLRRTVHTKPQALLHREARLANMDGAFRAADAIQGARVVLVDDVMTTGATMSECARACRAAGAARVYGLTFAR